MTQGRLGGAEKLEGGKAGRGKKDRKTKGRVLADEMDLGEGVEEGMDMDEDVDMEVEQRGGLIAAPMIGKSVCLYYFFSPSLRYCIRSESLCVP